MPTLQDRRSVSVHKMQKDETEPGFYFVSCWTSETDGEPLCTCCTGRCPSFGSVLHSSSSSEAVSFLLWWWRFCWTRTSLTMLTFSLRAVQRGCPSSPALAARASFCWMWYSWNRMEIRWVIFRYFCRQDSEQLDWKTKQEQFRSESRKLPCVRDETFIVSETSADSVSTFTWPSKSSKYFN